MSPDCLGLGQNKKSSLENGLLKMECYRYLMLLKLFQAEIVLFMSQRKLWLKTVEFTPRGSWLRKLSEFPNALIEQLFLTSHSVSVNGVNTP